MRSNGLLKPTSEPCHTTVSGRELTTMWKTWELENARLRQLGSGVRTGLLAYLFSVSFHNLQVPAAHQPVLELVNHVSLKASGSAQTRNRHHQRDISAAKNIQVAKCGVWVLSSTPARCRAAHSVQRGGNGEKCMDLPGSIQGSTSTCWNLEQLSMGSSGVYGPHQTFIPKASLQRIQW